MEIYRKKINFRDSSLFHADTELYSNNLKKINEFQPNTYKQSHFNKISKFFTERHPLKDATFVSSSIAGLALLILTFCCCLCCCPATCSTVMTRCCGLGCNVGSIIAKRLVDSPRCRAQPHESHQLHRLNPVPNQDQLNRSCINGIEHCECKITHKRCLRLINLEKY